jgi:5-methyltetrahydropteroyltriglutamate--homocysteine methyltransferase
MLTTTIGSYPKPSFMRLPHPFASRDEPTTPYTRWLESRSPEDVTHIIEGTKVIVEEQCACGIDIPTDGEAPREHYIYYHLRQLDGIDFTALREKTMRNGAWSGRVPTVRKPIQAGDPFLVQDWRTAQAATERPIKMTVPGPMTIVDSLADRFYGDPKRLGNVFAEALNLELRRLAEAGCRHIQVDEPLFARQPAQAIEWGFDALERSVHGLPREVCRVIHICCGYPTALDTVDYPKANPEAYFDLAEGIEASSFDAVSLEDAHRKIDLSLLERFQRTSVILGVVDIASTRIEPVDEIRSRLKDARRHIEPDRLIAGPDCGLAMLDRETALSKLLSLSEAAHSFEPERPPIRLKPTRPIGSYAKVLGSATRPMNKIAPVRLSRIKNRKG